MDFGEENFPRQYVTLLQRYLTRKNLTTVMVVFLAGHLITLVFFRTQMMMKMMNLLYHMSRAKSLLLRRSSIFESIGSRFDKDF